MFSQFKYTQINWLGNIKDQNRVKIPKVNKSGVAESGDDFTKFSTISQWFQMLIHPPLMQRLFFLFCSQRMIGVGSFMNVTEEL
ncbi:MAG: hypothetical protein HRU34_05140 [Richelia sp.]|nr:hypothetical protein [Richelia sp.]